MAWPVLTLRVAFASDPMDAAPAWTTITGDVRRIHIKRGRNHELNRMEAGTMSLELRNFHGNYWPFNVGGAYSPNVLPGKRINLYAVYNAVPYHLFTGFFEDYNPTWLYENTGLLPIIQPKCFDLINNLANYDLNNAGEAQELSGARVGNVLDELGWPNESAGNFGNDNAEVLWMTIKNQIRATKFTTDQKYTATAIVARLDGEAGVARNAKGAIYDSSLNLVAETDEVAIGFGVAWVTFNFPLPISLAVGQDYWFAVWGTIGGANDILLAYHAGGINQFASDNILYNGYPDPLVPDGYGNFEASIYITYKIDRDLDAGQSLMQATGAQADIKAMEHLFKVQNSELGIIYIAGNGDVVFEDRAHRLRAPHTVSQAIFGDDLAENIYHGMQPRYGASDIRNDIRITRNGGVQQTGTDAVSQTAYGKRTFRRTGLLMTTDGEALDQANYLKKRYKAPALRNRILRVLPEREPNNLWPQVLGREISDRITVRRNEASIDSDYMIEGVEHDINMVDNIWVTRWQLSNADAQKYWLIGVVGFSEIGLTTWVGY